MQQVLIFSIVILFYIQACKPNINNKDVLAKVGDNVLLSDEVNFVGTYGNKEDSAEFIKLFVERWIKKQLLLQKAQLNLSAEQSNIEKMVFDYRASLLIYKYQQEMLVQKMDTSVSNVEMENYYAEHKSDFILDSAIVKARMVKAPLLYSQINVLRKMIKPDDPEQIAQLENLCFQNKIFYHLTNEWISLGVLNLMFPAGGEFFKYTPYHEKADTSFVYLLYVTDFKLANDTTPFEYAKEKIKELILRKRKVKFIKDLENSIYLDGIKNNSFTKYIQ